MTDSQSPTPSHRRTPQAVRRGAVEPAARRRTALAGVAISRRHWVAASILGAGLLSAALLLPSLAATLSEPDAVVSIELAVPPAAAATGTDIAPAKVTFDWQTVRVDRGQTLGAIFTSLGLSGQDLHRILELPGTREPLTRIRPGDEFGFAFAADGSLRGLRFDRDEATRVVLEVDGEQINEQVLPRVVQHRVNVASGEITDSLYGAGERAGMSSAAILELAKAFGYDIDFAQDLRVGDRFHVVYEEVWRDGERLRQGDVLAATFINQGKQYQVFRYQFADGRTEYFDGEGRPTKKSFLRMPIDFARISSRFSSARRHPVLGTTRAHKGVDYAAGNGTPIMAAGDGKVTYAGWKGGYGRVVIVDHGNKVTTLYAHMSRLGGYKTGSRVQQGSVIGYVGASGLATGPHLHYEFRVAGVHRDPLKVTLPKPQPLPGSELARFRLQTEPMLAQLGLLAGGRAYARR